MYDDWNPQKDVSPGAAVHVPDFGKPSQARRCCSQRGSFVKITPYMLSVRQGTQAATEERMKDTGWINHLNIEWSVPTEYITSAGGLSVVTGGGSIWGVW